MLMQILNQRGAAWIAVAEHQKVQVDFAPALTIAEELQHPLGLQSNLEWLGKTAAKQRDFELALNYYRESERVIESFEEEFA